MDFCSTCYPLTLPACPDSITLPSDLPADTYYVWVTDRFGIKYVQEVTVGVSGDVVINTTTFPPGMFTENSGYYTVTVSTSNTDETRETFTVSLSDYDCYVINFQEVTEA